MIPETRQEVAGGWKAGHIHTVQGGAPEIAKLVYNSNNYGLWYL